MTARRKPTKAERERRTVEAQQQAFQLNQMLVRIARGISKTQDSDLMDAWDWFFSFFRQSIEKTATLEDDAQRIRKAAADHRRAFSDEQYEAARPLRCGEVDNGGAPRAKNDKDLARQLGVHPTTIARYKAQKNQKPSLTEEIFEETRALRRRKHDELSKALFMANEDLADAKAEIELAKTVNARLKAENAALRAEVRQRKKA